MQCIRNKQENLVSILLEAHADVNARNSHSYTPLAIAAQTDNVNMVMQLIKAHAEVDAFLEETGQVCHAVLSCLLLALFSSFGSLAIRFACIYRRR